MLQKIRRTIANRQEPEKEQMNLAQLIFIFLMINTKHGYSKPVKCSAPKSVMKTYENTVLTLLHQTKHFTNIHESNYTLRNITRIPQFNQFLIMNNTIIKVVTLLQYRSTLKDYHSALSSFGENLRINHLKVIIENNFVQLDQIIQCLPDAKIRTTTARFNKNEIEKKSEEVFKEHLSSIQIKIVYAIMVQFINFLYDFRKFLFNFARHI